MQVGSLIISFIYLDTSLFLVDCEESFRHPRHLLEHNRAEHNGKGSLRPTPKPFKPDLPPLPPTPESLPSYMSVSRRVVKAKISEERHQELGPWVSDLSVIKVHERNNNCHRRRSY